MDLETTGLDLKKDEIVAIGATQISNGRIISEKSFYTQVKPENQPSTGSMKIHGLRNVDLELSPSIAIIYPDLAKLIENRIVIAHAAWVERAFLNRQARGLFPHKVLDTAILAQSLGVVENSPNKEPSLEFIARRLKLPVYAPHNALGDAMTTSVVFLALVNILERNVKIRSSTELSLAMIWEKSKR